MVRFPNFDRNCGDVSQAALWSNKEDERVLTGCRRSLRWTSSPRLYCTASGREPLELRIKRQRHQLAQWVVCQLELHDSLWLWEKIHNHTSRSASNPASFTLLLKSTNTKYLKCKKASKDASYLTEVNLIWSYEELVNWLLDTLGLFISCLLFIL